MSLTLYEIGGEFQRLMNLLEESGGEVSPEIAAALDALDLADQKKVEAYCQVIRNFEARALVRKAEAKRFTEAAQRDEKAADRLAQRLQQHLERTGRAKIDTDLFTVSLRANPPRVEYAGNPEALPARFRRVHVELDKGEVLKAHRAGEEMPPGVQICRAQHVEIR